MIAVHETAAGVTFQVKVQPRARRNAIVGALGDALKVTLTAPPVNGRANDACIELLSDTLRVARSSIAVVAGHSSRRKIIRVSGITAAQLRERLKL